MRTQAYNNAIHQGGLCEFAPEFDALKRYAPVCNIALPRCMDGELYAKFKVSSSESDYASLICSTKVHSKLFEAITQINLKESL